MHQEELVFVGICDLAGLVRGKAFPAVELDQRLSQGMGMTGSNIMISAFGTIFSSPFGTKGDLVMKPDPTTGVLVPFDGAAAERFYIGDLQELDGAPWSCCPRDFLRRGLAALEHEAGLRLKGAFEQEFVHLGIEDRPGDAYSLSSFRRQGIFGESVVGALRAAGITPDSFLPEYAPRQFEVTVKPTYGMRIADEAVITREILRAVAERSGHRVTLAPVMAPDGVGSGTHIHFSLWDKDGKPASRDVAGPYGISARMAPFVAGVLHHLPALTAVTAPSVASYYRLQPDRWAPVWAFLGSQDRGAALRVAPLFQGAEDRADRQFNIEFRVGDATACPYMALGAIVHAGLDGIRKNMALPAELPDFWQMPETARAEAGVRTLPRSLDDALDLLEATDAAKDWFGEPLLSAYLEFKRSEIRALDALEPSDICDRYAAIY
ncbi:glutamine synthetase family protein [Acidisoma silvae]|uniref:Glutamine synthetase n=1 Tax=Acidisoma silvae TaxID=2802396 RepID=A0A963YR36_9PROT|nr:glutamine synthetase family protein [Acidisoma silvae]MCB8875437.1 glutamine synthetase [Acidisoma silvae]